MAAYLASRFITRPDLRDEFLPQFIEYCFELWVDSIQVWSECPLRPIAQSPSVSTVFASISALSCAAWSFILRVTSVPTQG
ncbi:hypothetical protein E2C01_069671 [Portunus trituberculatus]|uniref:Uncharacterized protein n=1 Tax=Portunus trituberculatus TaxID=210409 RepID=A0A5B7HZI3_PORTR|nr:hypothetical protein [Portunus trituberculatus]